MQKHQRIVVSMIDGFGSDYLKASPLKNINQMANNGFYKQVSAVIPSVTNSNNVSIACGSLPNKHGITGNYYFNENTGDHDYMENSDFILTPTIMQKAAALGIKSALLTSKKKTINLLSKGCEIAIAAEDPPQEFIDHHGNPPEIYSREINYWLWNVAIDILKNRPDIGLVYVHTTDFPMHKWAATEAESIEHMEKLDELHGQALKVAPDAAFLITADHGMNYKSRCWDLAKALDNRGTPVRFAMSAEKDRYVKHHRTFGGVAWIYLNHPDDSAKVIKSLESLDGIESVMSREDAAKTWHLMPERIGHLCVFGDKDTVFGEMEGEYEDLPEVYRTHGSTHELDVPLIIYNYNGTLPPDQRFKHNADLTHMLYE